jgi:hypothetical protein
LKSRKEIPGDVTSSWEAFLLRAIGLLAFCALLLCLSLPVFAGDDWQPVSPQDLIMTGEPKAPGAQAIFLYRQIDRDDEKGQQTTYERIKILTEEGRKYANVEIPFLKGHENIKNIRARSIQPDGSIKELESKPYEKTIVKARGVKYLAKTFALPDVRVGTIVEYRYTDEIDPEFVYDSYWSLSSYLFTKVGKFSLKPANLTLTWSWPNGLPEGTEHPHQDHGRILLEIRDVPAFEEEDYMPPKRELEYRMDFIYQGRRGELDEAKYWQNYGESRFFENERFLNKSKVLAEAASTIVQPSDDAGTKLRKLYGRVQQLRNFTFEREKTEQELKRENRRDIYTVDDVWKQGGGTASQINYVFIALVRAVGMQAFLIDVPGRDTAFFDPKYLNFAKLNNNIVHVKLAEKDLYLDPGTPHTPFGLLPWYKTLVKGFQCDKDGGDWIDIPVSDVDITQVQRRAILRLSDDGSLEGKLTLTYLGQEALEIRRDGDEQDDAGRKKMLEDAVRDLVSTSAELSLANKPDWDSSSTTFVAEFTIKVPEWVSNAGRHQLLPVGLFAASEKHLFEHASRVHPIYLHYATSKADDITITLPAGWKVGSAPAAINRDQKALAYSAKIEATTDTVHIARTLRLHIISVGLDHYPALRDFFQFVRSSDEQQIVLQPAG